MFETVCQSEGFHIAEKHLILTTARTKASCDSEPQFRQNDEGRKYTATVAAEAFQIVCLRHRLFVLCVLCRVGVYSPRRVNCDFSRWECQSSGWQCRLSHRISSDKMSEGNPRTQRGRCRPGREERDNIILRPKAKTNPVV